MSLEHCTKAVSLLGKTGLAATYIGRPARKTGISVTCVEAGRLCELRKAWMTFLEISVTTCMVMGAVALADKKVVNMSRIEESLLERIETGVLDDIVDDVDSV